MIPTYSWTAEVVKRSGVTKTFDLDVAQGSITFSPNNQASTCQFMFRPKDYEASPKLQTGDCINLYYRLDRLRPKKDILLKPFFVRNVKKQTSLDTYLYTVTAIDYNHYFLSFLGTKANTAADFLMHIRVYLADVDNNNSLAGLPAITLADDVPVKKSNGTAFPSVVYFASYKPLNEILNELCSNEYTGDGKYDWYIDNKNKLHIYKSSQFAAFSLNDYIISDYTYDNGVSNIINQCIVYAGVDLNDSPIYAHQSNLSSIARFGLHDKLEIKQSFREEEYKLHKDDVDFDNDKFREYVLLRANNYAKDVVDKGWAEPIETVEISTYACDIPVYSKVSLPSFIGNAKQMYTKQVTHTLTKTGGWITKLQLTQEEGLNRG